jgi:hypothetical protein
VEKTSNASQTANRNETIAQTVGCNSQNAYHHPVFSPKFLLFKND